jgi:hypothetical protein
VIRRTCRRSGSNASVGRCAAYLPGEDEPTVYGMHGAIAEHYGAKPGEFPSHASTIDHVVGAAVG